RGRPLRGLGGTVHGQAPALGETGGDHRAARAGVHQVGPHGGGGALVGVDRGYARAAVAQGEGLGGGHAAGHRPERAHDRAGRRADGPGGVQAQHARAVGILDGVHVGGAPHATVDVGAPVRADGFKDAGYRAGGLDGGRHRQLGGARGAEHHAATALELDGGDPQAPVPAHAARLHRTAELGQRAPAERSPAESGPPQEGAPCAGRAERQRRQGGRGGVAEAGGDAEGEPQGAHRLLRLANGDGGLLGQGAKPRRGGEARREGGGDDRAGGGAEGEAGGGGG